MVYVKLYMQKRLQTLVNFDVAITDGKPLNVDGRSVGDFNNLS